MEDEDEAMSLVNELAAKYGWAVSVVTRRDAESFIDRPLTDEEWKWVLASDAWEDLHSNTMEAAEFQIKMALLYAGIKS